MGGGNTEIGKRGVKISSSGGGERELGGEYEKIAKDRAFGVVEWGGVGAGVCECGRVFIPERGGDVW